MKMNLGPILGGRRLFIAIGPLDGPICIPNLGASIQNLKIQEFKRLNFKNCRKNELPGIPV